MVIIIRKFSPLHEHCLIMSILNLGMQCVGLMRQEINAEMENLINSCNSMEDIREKAKTNNQLEKELLTSLEPTKELLGNIFERQSLKDESFELFEPATKLEMENFWESVHVIDDSITMDDTSQKKVANKVSMHMNYANHLAILIINISLF